MTVQVLQHRVQGEPGPTFLYNPIVFGRLPNPGEGNADRTWREWMYEYVIGPAEFKCLRTHPEGFKKINKRVEDFEYEVRSD